MHSFLILELRWEVSLMCCNYLVNTLVLSTVHTMLMSKLNCINCLTNMRASLVQLGLKGLHNHHIIQVRKSRPGEESLAVEWSGVVGPSPLPPTSSSSTSAVSELSAYLDSDNVTYEDDFDLLLWWHDQKLTFPILSIMARDIISVHVSIVSLEFCFSLTGRIIEERRRRLLPDIVEMLICLKDWELGEKRE